MSVYGRGTKNGQYIRQRNSYDNYSGESCSRRVDDPFSHSFDSMIENARNKVIEQDKINKRLEEQKSKDLEQIKELELKISKIKNKTNIENIEDIELSNFCINNIEINNTNIETKNKHYINIKNSLFISSIISIISILNLWVLTNNFNSNNVFITLSFMFNFLCFMFFIPKYLTESIFKNNECFKYISKKRFFVEIFLLISVLMNTYYVFTY